MADDDFLERFDAMPIDELRRRTDMAVAYVREMRNALAVESGMTLEGAPGPIPRVDMEQGRRVFEELMQSLPLLRRRLTPEERARMQPMSMGAQEEMEELLKEIAAHPEELEEVDGGVTAAKVEKLLEGVEKSQMLEEVEREVVAYHSELLEYRERLAERAEQVLARLKSKIGEA